VVGEAKLGHVCGASASLWGAVKDDGKPWAVGLHRFVAVRQTRRPAWAVPRYPAQHSVSVIFVNGNENRCHYVQENENENDSGEWYGTEYKE